MCVEHLNTHPCNGAEVLVEDSLPRPFMIVLTSAALSTGNLFKYCVRFLQERCFLFSSCQFVFFHWIHVSSRCFVVHPIMGETLCVSNVFT